jgi:hypothetical protein
MVGLLTVVLFTCAALVVDLGLARSTRLQAQATADAGALAAANVLYVHGVPDTAAAVAAVQAYAARNFGTTDAEWAACTDPNRPTDFAAVPGQTDCVSFAGLPTPTELRVVVPTRSVKTPFASLIGIRKVPVRALAQAKLTAGGAAACGLCVIGPGLHDIQNGNVSVSGADVYFNGTVDSRSNGSVVAAAGGSIHLQGTKPPQGTWVPAPAQNQPAIADPLAFLTLPPSTAGLTAKTGSACGLGATAGPGIYRSLGVTGTCTLQPGVYVVTDQNHLSGQEVLNAPGVTLYFTCQSSSTSLPSPRPCDAGESGGDLLMTGQTVFNISAPPTGPTAGLAVASDRNNTATLGWRGNGLLQTAGTIYAKSGTLNYRGNGAGLALDSLIVVGDLSFNGNPSAFTSVYTVAKNVQLPPGALYLSR